MKTIWKFTVENWSTITAPAGAFVLSAQIQNGELCVWAAVDPNIPPVAVQLSVFFTGVDLPADPGRYINTVQTENGYLVVHVFQPDA